MPLPPLQGAPQDSPASPSAIARIVYRGPGQARLPLHLSLPSGCEGMARQGALPLVGKIRTSLRRCGSASRRAARTSFNARAHLRSSSFRFAHCRKRNLLRRAALSGTPSAGRPYRPHPSARSGRRLVVAAGRGTARGPGAWEERSSPARGRRILLHHQTPLDDAPRLSRTIGLYS